MNSRNINTVSLESLARRAVHEGVSSLDAAEVERLAVNGKPFLPESIFLVVVEQHKRNKQASVVLE